MPVHLLWGFTDDETGSSTIVSDVVSDRKPLVQADSQTPAVDALEMDPNVSRAEELRAAGYSEGDGTPSVLTKRLRPKIIDVEEE